MKKLMITMSLALFTVFGASAQQPASGTAAQQPSTGAQQNASPTEITPLQPLQPIGQEQPAAQDTIPVIEPDNTPLSGVLDMTLGVPETQQRNYFVPSFRYAQSLQSQPALGNPMDYAWHSRGDLGANVRFEHSLLPGGSFHYNGIMNWSSYQNDEVRHYHQFGITQAFTLNRWRFTAADEGSYSPASQFGYAGLQGLGTAVGGLNQFAQFGPQANTFRPSVSPDQSILQEDAPRISNTVALQSEYSLTARSSVSMNGTYGLMRGIGSDVVDSDQYSLGGGYNYRMSARSTVGAQYGFSAITFPQSGGREVTTHSVQGGFGRKVTGRLAMNISGGAQFVDVAAAGLPDLSTVYFGGDSNITYERGRHAAMVHAYRHVSNGSGVFAGAKTTAVQGSYSERLARTWNVVFNGGYAHNASFGTSGFDSEFGGVSINHHIGRYLGAFLNYNISHQTPFGPCVGTICGTQYRHVFSIGLNWSYRPIQVF